MYSSFPIECSGRTEVTYTHPAKKTWHRITCYQPVEIDWNQRLLRCLKSEGNAHTQIQFMDPKRQIYADNLIIHYHLHQDNLNLKELTLFGEVKLIQQELQGDGSPCHVQYALADHLNYYHATEELFLTAKEGENVLYFDEIHNYKMSAPEVIVRRNPATDKFSIQGMGAVRFNFKEQELNQLKQNFSRRPEI